MLPASFFRVFRQLTIAFAACVLLLAASGPAALADVCKPWQSQTDSYCVDKDGLQTRELGYAPQEGERCWERSRTTCKCESGQSAEGETCGSCETVGTESVDIVCLPY